MGKLVSDTILKEFQAYKAQKKALKEELELISFEGNKGYNLTKKLLKVKAKLEILKSLKNAVIAEDELKKEKNEPKINKGA